MTDTKHLVKLTFFGDSICVGQGISIYKGWIAQLARDIDTDFAHRGVNLLVTNASVNGRTTRLALEDMPYQVQASGVDLLITQFGLNDCNYWLTDRGNARVSLDAFKANIKEIVARARSFGAKRILLNNNHPTLRDEDVFPNTNLTLEMSNRIYNSALRELAPELGEDVDFQDVERHFHEIAPTREDLAHLLLPDGLHLSSEGHNCYLDFVGKQVKSVLSGLIEAFKTSTQDIE